MSIYNSYMLKNAYKYQFNVFVSLKKLKNMNLVFARFKKFKREESNFLASLRKLKKHGFNFLQA